jgi:replicative DNA helicase
MSPPLLSQSNGASLEAEAAVIAACLDPVEGPAVLDKVGSLLLPQQFYSERHRWIFDAIRTLFARGELVDIVTVVHELRENGRLAEVGGAAYVAQLFGETPATAHVIEHARIVVGNWARREFSRAASEAAARASTGEPLEEVAARFHARLEGLALRDRPGRDIEIISAEEIFAELAPPSYVAEGILRRGSLTLIGGYGSSGKTWLAVALLVAVATGSKWLGRFQCHQGPARFFDYESDTYEMKRRIQRVAHGMGIRDAVKALDLVSLPRLYITQSDSEARFTELAKGRAIVIIDSLRAASVGLDENDSRIREGLDRLRAVANRTQCAIVVVVHAKKTSGAAGEIDNRETLRGSSAIFDAADLVLTVGYKKKKPLLVQQAKARHGVPVQPFGVELRDTPLGKGILVEACDLPDESSPGAELEEHTDLCRKIMHHVRTQPGLSGRELRGLIRVRVTYIDGACETLIRAGQLEARDRKGKGGGFSYFPVVPQPQSSTEGDE